MSDDPWNIPDPATTPQKHSIHKQIGYLASKHSHVTKLFNREDAGEAMSYLIPLVGLFKKYADQLPRPVEVEKTPSTNA
jgi:hypothetical protein